MTYVLWMQLVLTLVVLGVIVQRGATARRERVRRHHVLPSWSLVAALQDQSQVLGGLGQQIAALPVLQREVQTIQAEVQQLRALVAQWAAPGGPTDQQVLCGLFAAEL